MSFGTTNLHGTGFIVRGVPAYLDDNAKSAPHAVFKGRKGAEKKADAEALWSAKSIPDQVEGVVAAQIEGYDYWFVVWIYTDEAAAKNVEREMRNARQETIRRNAVRA